jgi:hypothetical protein
MNFRRIGVVFGALACAGISATVMGANSTAAGDAGPAIHTPVCVSA